MKSTRREFLKRSSAVALAGVAASQFGEAQSKLRSSELANYDATGLAELVRKKQVTPLELVEDVLKRIERVNPKLNAVLANNFDVEKARARAKQPLGDGAFAGVPVLLKNICEYKDADIDFGSRLYARAIAKHGRLHKANSPFTDKMEQSGFIVVGVTNAPEFGLIETTEPVLHGAAHNPWNPDYTTGGSSGGSAAAVAAGPRARPGTAAPRRPCSGAGSPSA